MYILTLASAKPRSEEAQAQERLLAERRRLEELGFEVWRENKRFCISLRIRTFEDAQELWGSDFFWPNTSYNHKPEIVSITFSGVRCQSVCSVIQGKIDKVIIINLSDPIHSRLFHFGLDIQLDPYVESPSIKVSVAGTELQRLDCLENLLRVLRICAARFYQEKDVPFQSRKYLGRAKRRYLLWLEREGQLPASLESAYQAAKRNTLTIGKLEGVKTAWEHAVAVERDLQQVP